MGMIGNDAERARRRRGHVEPSASPSVADAVQGLPEVVRGLE